MVLIRSPFRVTFAYAGPDQIWMPNWRDQMLLPSKVRVSIRDSANGQLLAVSSAATVRINAPAECVQTKVLSDCLVRKTADASRQAGRP